MKFINKYLLEELAVAVIYGTLGAYLTVLLLVLTKQI